MIKLLANVCAAHQTYVVTFEGPLAEAMAIDFFTRKAATHAFSELEGADQINEHRYPQLLEVMYPTCLHGLSLSLCNGPEHYGNN